MSTLRSYILYTGLYFTQGTWPSLFDARLSWCVIFALS